MKVFALILDYYVEDYLDYKIIGIFSSKEEAKLVREHFNQNEEFCTLYGNYDYQTRKYHPPDDRLFKIVEYELGNYSL